MSRPRAEPAGRYDGGFDARVPANGLGRPPDSPNVDLAVAAVEDPMEPNRRLKASVNRRVDVLEMERSHRRITEAAYRAGRVAQAVFERASGARSPAVAPGERVDATHARETGAILALEDARVIAAYERWILSVLGQVDARILRAVLREGRTFAQAARERGRDGARGTAYLAERFRDALEQLAHARAAHGKDPARLRAERNAPVPGEAYDERGRLAPEGAGYRVGDRE